MADECAVVVDRKPKPPNNKNLELIRPYFFKSVDISHDAESNLVF